MAYQPPTNTSLWQAILTGEDGYVTTIADALEEHGPETYVEISIRRLTALPVAQDGGDLDDVWRLPGIYTSADVTAEWTLDLLDDDGETTQVQRQYDAAQAMAAGLNGALANQGDWNRGTALAASLHDVADKLAVFDGAIPGVNLHLRFAGHNRDNIPKVDELGTALINCSGESKHSHGTTWEHEASAQLEGALTVNVYTYMPAPPEDDPAALKARIAELESQIAAGGDR